MVDAVKELQPLRYINTEQTVSLSLGESEKVVSASIHGEREKAPSLFGIRIGDNINTLADLLPAGFERQTDLFGEDISQREDYFSFLKSETGDTVSFFCDIESKEIYEISYSASGLKAEEIDANTYGLTTEEYENRFSALEEFHEDQLVQITSIKSKDEIYGGQDYSFGIKNNSGTSIKSLVLGICAWDENGLQLLLSDDMIGANTEYFIEKSRANVNLVDGAEGEITHTLYANGVKYMKLIVVRFETSDGQIYENPYTEFFKEMYEDKVLNTEYGMTELRAAVSNQHQGEDNSADYIIENSSTKKLNVDDILHLTEAEKQLASNEIYARHGRKFMDAAIQEHFNSKAWYSGTIEPDDFDADKYFNQIEKDNINLLAGEQKEEASLQEETVNDAFIGVSGGYMSSLGSDDRLPYLNIIVYSDGTISCKIDAIVNWVEGTATIVDNNTAVLKEYGLNIRLVWSDAGTVTVYNDGEHCGDQAVEDAIDGYTYINNSYYQVS